MLTITPQDCIVHWSGSFFENGSARFIDTTMTLPYQDGSKICDSRASTEILDYSSEEESSTGYGDNRIREVFMVRRPQSPLVPLEEPDVRSSDESESNISPDEQGYEDKTKSQGLARERRNKLKQGRRNRVAQRKDTWTRYKNNLAEYNKKKSEREAEERRVAEKIQDTPYDKIQELAQELEAISNPDEE